MRAPKKLPYPRELLKELAAPLRKDFWIIKKRFWLVWLVWATKFTIAGLAMVIISFISFWVFAYYYTGDLKDSKGKPINWDKIRNGDFKKSSTVLAANDEVIYQFFWEVRDPIKLQEIPDIVPKGFVAAEDENFWIHPGIDPSAIGRAFVGNKLRDFGIKIWSPSGGSTVAQQGARLSYGEEVPEFGNRERSYKRKLTEARFAIQLVKRYPREELLAAFLNMPYLGHGAYGVAAAWHRYFGENIRNSTGTRINLIQKTAILVALNKSPQKYCPIFHEPPKPEIRPEMAEEEIAQLQKKYIAERDKEKLRAKIARERWNWVLYQMREEDSITNKEYYATLFSEEFTEENLTKLDILRVTPFKNQDFGYSARLVKEVLLGTGYQDENITHYGGLKIKTCLDTNIQQIINREGAKHLAKLNEEVKDKSNPIEGSIVVLNVENGCIEGLFGGHNFSETPYNRALAARSVGSAFKPFVYATALERGKTFNDMILNQPFSMRGAGGKRWVPQNFREDRPVPFGLIPFYVGYIRSVNLPTLWLARESGMDPIINLTHRLGVWGLRGVVKDNHGRVVFKLPGIENTGDGLVPLLPTAIGASDVNLIELANAFAVFLRGGAYLPPRLILEVKDAEGKVLFKAPEPRPERVISEETARQIVILSRAVTKVGTAKISMRNIKQEMAAKTGTSNGPDNVSIISGNPKRVIGIRFGYDKPKPIEIPRYMKSVSGNPNMQVTGGWVAGFLLRKLVDQMYADQPIVQFSTQVENGVEELLADYPEKYK